MRLWLLDRGAEWFSHAADVVSLPFALASRWCADEWRRRR